jgi:3-mercaptopyruvate sulfurtransferase SseA
MSPEELERHSQEIPRDREVILYCTCPNEASSARVALLLRRRGIQRIRPLAGGLHTWREAEFPVEAVTAEPSYS